MRKLLETLFLGLLFSGYLWAADQNKMPISCVVEEIQDTLPVIRYEAIPEITEERPDSDIVTVTKYSPTKKECGEGHLITADGSRINLEKLRRHELRWMAISRDLLGKYKMGDTVIIKSTGADISGEWVIHDVMPRRWKKKIDILVPPHDKYGFHAPHKVVIRKKE